MFDRHHGDNRYGRKRHPSPAESAEFVGDLTGEYDVIFIAGGEDKLWVGRAHSVDMRKFAARIRNREARSAYPVPS